MWNIGGGEVVVFLCLFVVKDKIECNLHTFPILWFPLCDHHLLQHIGSNIPLFFLLKQLYYQYY